MNIIEDWIKSFCIDYIDPDGIYINNKNEFKYKNKVYYLRYVEYLKNRSDKFDIKMEDNKPGLLMINKETKKEYYLKSDQFGFSAPSIYLNHPYDIYLKMYSNNNLCVAIEKVKM